MLLVDVISTTYTYTIVRLYARYNYGDYDYLPTPIRYSYVGYNYTPIRIYAMFASKTY